MWKESKRGLYKQFVFENFDEAWDFMERVASVAKRLDHHPRWQNEWNTVDIWLSTHDAGVQITERDHDLARAIDAVAKNLKKSELETSVEKKSTSITEIKLFADGGSRGNPGPSASGFVLMDMDNRVLLERGVYLGVTTNNQAEYQALKFGLEAALAKNFRTVHVYMDSLLVVNQMKGVFKVKNRDLWPINGAIKDLVSKFRHIDFSHVPREMNKLADAEVNKALDKALKS